MSIERLNRQFAIPGQLSFIQGHGGMPFIRVDNDSATALISLYGAQVLSYRPYEHSHDVLFLTEKAVFQEGKAIRGGIPICWPWFGKRLDRPDYPGHGIARIALWSVLETRQLEQGETLIRLSLNEQSIRQPWWPHRFELELSVTVGNKLVLELISRNNGNQPFTITQSFHAYFKVGSIGHCRLSGLENTDYIDNLDAGRQKIRVGAFTPTEAIEQVYHLPNSVVTIIDEMLKRRITTSSAGTDSVVVWNPWTTFSASMSDLGETDYRHFICVEPGHVGEKAVELPPNAEFKLQTVIGVDRV